MMRRIDQTLPRRRAIELALGAAAIVATRPTLASAQATPTAQSEYPGNTESPLLVSAEWLNTQLNERTLNLVVLDLGEWPDYRDGHIPGAVHSYWQETIERNYDVYGAVLNQKDYNTNEDNQIKRIDWLKRYGIADDATVVAYDHGNGRHAARIVWFLRFLGHSQSAVLDGGIDAWQKMGGSIQKSEANPPALVTAPTVSPQDGFYLVTSQLQEALTDPTVVLVDIRSDEERHDTVDDQYDLGQIPGSIWAPWIDFVAGEHGQFLPAAEALQKWNVLGVTPDKRVVLYGRFGTDPDQMWLLLKLLAYPNVLIYDRGWVEWSSTGDLPIEPI